MRALWVALIAGGMFIYIGCGGDRGPRDPGPTDVVVTAGVVDSSVAGIGLTRRLARFIVETKEADIPPEAYEHASLAVLDWLGVTLAGSRDPLVRMLVDYTDVVGGIPQSSVLGHNVKKSVTQAALINGAASHALDFDDTHAAFRGHPTASIVATILALSEMEQKSGKELLAAYLVGLQVGIAVAESAADQMYAMGMHNTSALGVIASAAAAAHLLDLDEEPTSNTLAIATTQAFGFKRSFGTMSKPLHAGAAAEAAVAAALLAREGFTGATDIFEGPNGLLDAWGESVVNEVALESLGREWGVKDISVKYYASCHWTHGAIVTAQQIAERDGVKPEDIKAIEFTVSPIAFKTAGVIHPSAGLEGKFSIPYSAANALVTGKVGIQGFTEQAVQNPEVAALIDRTDIVVAENDSWFYTEASIETNAGETYTAAVDVMANLPSLEHKREGVTKKFSDLVGPILGEERTAEVIVTILALETLPDVSDLNPSRGLQYLRELAVRVVETPLSGYVPEVWD